ncbi:ABC transporter permease [Cohnella laeviribosi]|jgi:peptide/nickel transport system permease protein|uniref:ABC transporter permease n=1 Tax=Cohnella laeviribosi TaxID=380174 RepID=UPI00038194DD|nr:ABC transporter permease [Cohnella laeviribosi]
MERHYRLTRRFMPGNRMNRRQRSAVTAVLIAVLLAAVSIGAALLGQGGLNTHLDMRNLPPSAMHPFGTDWLGRDMFTRTVKGLALSVRVGLAAACFSAAIAAAVGLASAALGKTADRLLSWLIDLFLSVPHLVSLILIAFVCGGGMKGVIAGVALTHWPSLARIIRAEALQLRAADYAHVSRRLGKSRWWVATRHFMPHIAPQLLVGLLMLFPHAILHEAAISFIGLGLSPHEPSIGIILSEAMRYLSAGLWWLAVFPGLALLVVVRSFDRLGEHVRCLTDPRHARE